MSTSSSSVAAALTVATLAAANANKSASAGVVLGPSSPTTLCSQHQQQHQSDVKSPPSYCQSPLTTPTIDIDTNKVSHQIGTNLADLSVCWHKMETTSDGCCAAAKCGRPFYDANQFECDACGGNNGASLDENEDKDATVRSSKTLGTSVWYSSTSSSTINSSCCSDADGTASSQDIEQTRKSFQDEFSSLIIKSDNFKSFILPLEDSKNANSNESNANGSSSGYNNKTFSIKDLIEQVNLFNKYNTSKFTELRLEMPKNENSGLIIRGMIKIHWNLKKPIRLTHETIESGTTDETNNNHNSFKATSLKDLNKKKQLQTSLDDSSMTSTSTLTSSVADSNAFLRSQTVKCKPAKWKRAPILGNIIANPSEENQMFVPSYGSVSSICIDNSVTCLKAISILFDKFQILSSPNEFSLYKVYQSGDVKELNDDDKPLMERLWMGPFANEDRIFIMEKGRQLGVTNSAAHKEAASMICLPHEFLRVLIDKSKQEELKDIEYLKSTYRVYSDFLKTRLKA